MEIGQTYRISGIVYGWCSGKVYGGTGDLVKLIALHGNVAIVEGNTERFPLAADQLGETPQTMQIDKPAITEGKQPIQPVPMPKSSQPASRRKAKQTTKSVTQNPTLF